MTLSMSELYRHTQPGRIIVGIMFPIVILVFTFLMWSHTTEESDIISDVVLVCVGALMLVIMWLFSSLTIVVTSGHFEFWLGPGVARHSIPIGRIVSAEAVRNKAIMGLGIKYGPGYVIYAVSGLDAIEVVYRKDGSGKKRTIRVGTDDPEQLMSTMDLLMRGRNKGKKESKL